MGTVKRTLSDDNGSSVPKRSRTVGNPAPPSIVPDHGLRKSSKHPFLDDNTGFASGVSIHHFMHPQATKLYVAVRVSALAFQLIVES